MAVAPPSGRLVPRQAAGPAPHGGTAVALHGDVERRFDIRTTSLWWGNRFELRDATLFDHLTGHTHGMPLNDGVPLDAEEIAFALLRLGAGRDVARAFLDAALLHPARMTTPEEGRQLVLQAAMARGAPQHRPNTRALPGPRPAGVTVVVKPFPDQGHAPPFGNRAGSTAL